jgi:ATP-dependent RNA helicase DBP3
VYRVSQVVIHNPIHIMSIEAEKKVKLSKEEKEAKRARKEAKRLKAAGDAPAVAEASASVAEATTPAEAIEGVSKKEKKNKDKKRKEREESGGEAIIRGEESGADKQQKVKDDKKKRKVENGEVAQPDPATVAAPTQSEATTLAAPSEANAGLSKKQLKKLARAAEAEAAAAAGPSSSSTAEPLIKPGPFLASHNEYLATNAVTLLPQLYPPHLDITTLPISASLRPFLKKFTTPTPIQACSWPPLLASRDVVGIAETGSGKTLAFGVPGMNRLVSSGKKNKGPHMLVIAPTRELAQQSHTTLVELGKEAGVKSICVFGGVGKDEQIRGIKDSKIVVGTPGRLLDLADSGDLDLSG